ncbi:hypothetical protein DFH11DRAFT_1882883 [Phellopilus nigrolimitatus]|nr:hypothetical protein DFH11DRAFT_1882883 [Phellopilus nigrolimitatus]
MSFPRYQAHARALGRPRVPSSPRAHSNLAEPGREKRKTPQRHALPERRPCCDPRAHLKSWPAYDESNPVPAPVRNCAVPNPPAPHSPLPTPHSPLPTPSPPAPALPARRAPQVKPAHLRPFSTHLHPRPRPRATCSSPSLRAKPPPACVRACLSASQTRRRAAASYGPAPPEYSPCRPSGLHTTAAPGRATPPSPRARRAYQPSRCVAYGPMDTRHRRACLRYSHPKAEPALERIWRAPHRGQTSERTRAPPEGRVAGSTTSPAAPPAPAGLTFCGCSSQLPWLADTQKPGPSTSFSKTTGASPIRGYHAQCPLCATGPARLRII